MRGVKQTAYLVGRQLPLIHITAPPRHPRVRVQGVTLVVDQLLMIGTTWEEYSLTKTEIADGLYPPVCATTRMVVDHFAVGVMISSTVVGIMHSNLWHRFTPGELTSTLGRCTLVHGYAP